MARRLTAIGTVLVAAAGFWAASNAGPYLLALATTTALAVGAGAEAHVRLHPSFGRPGSRLTAGYWIGPALAAFAAALLAANLERTLALAVPPVGVVLLAMLLFAQHREIGGQSVERWTQLAYALILYLVAFVLFVLIYSGQIPGLLAAAGSGLVALLLSAALFRPSNARPARAWLFAAVVGLCVGELSLALGTWIGAGLLGGAFLLLYFYIAAGLVQALLEGHLDTRLAVEYGFVGLVGLALILSTSPWRS